MEALRGLFEKTFHQNVSLMEKLPGAGSNRNYYRLTGERGETAIGVIGTSREENHAFVCLCRHFFEKGLPVPQVFAISADGMRYLQTDLGRVSLFEALEKGRKQNGAYNEEEKSLLRKTIAELPRMQVLGARDLDFNCCYPQPEMDETSVFFDLNYFKYCFLKATGIEFHELKLEEDFKAMARDLLSECTDTFMYRDFQARNVMLCGGKPFFIDFQGGRKGPIEYDVASFLWQASAHYPQVLRQELIDVYLDSLQQYLPVDVELFRQRLSLFVLFRTLQVLGAYGFRGYFERKPHFLNSIPPAIANLRAMLDEHVCSYPYLRDVLRQLIALPRYSKREKTEMKSRLVVQIYSFSFFKGIPADESGNGGGYVFDCRGTNNPGRYEQYKELNGLDEPVVRFLDNDRGMFAFLQSVYQLADMHVENYLRRGFTHLMFSFGCTGGQHRSVYSAQHLAEHLNEKYSIEIHLCHREQNIHKIFQPRPQS